MTAPRQVLPGATYMVTRRCLQRQFLLRPSEVTTDVFLFVLGVAAREHGILLHGYCAMSNHIHLVLTDPHGRLPEFQQYVGALTARAVNASIGRFETFWAPGSFRALELQTRQDTVDKTVYVLANPVAAGLVRRGRQWPGAWSDPDSFGKRLVLKRPKHFFAEDGDLPESVELELSVPPGFASAAEFRDEVSTALRKREREEAQKRTRRGFLGVCRVLAQSPFGRPSSREPRRNLNPRVASRDKWKRIAALTRWKEFLEKYRTARAAWLGGDREVEFPAGTYLLRVTYGVRCTGFS